jgi:uncharacterized glyoxalase superfamily protein PhnB
MNQPSAPAGSGEPLSALSLQASITVKELQASLTWYTEVLGFSVDQKYEREGVFFAVSLRSGSVRILLNQDNGKKGWDRVVGEGLSLMITTAQNIDDFANRAKAHGGKLESEPADMPWGARFFRLKDPDGVLYTISSERRPPA